MIRKSVITFIAAGMCLLVSGQYDTVKISGFGLKPDTRENAVLYVQKALEACRDKSKPILIFSKGRYDFWPQYATEKMYYESNTDVIPLKG